MIVANGGAGTAPSGWLWCDGGTVSRTTYADLFAVIGTNWGAGDGSTTFGVPNLNVTTPRYLKGTTGTPGATGGSTTHSHPLSSLGGALMVLAASLSDMVRAARHTVPSWNSTQTITTLNPATTTSVSSSSAVDLTGDTDDANSEPPFATVRWMIST
jgi:microcystin-dependent protein